jgi:hypothetical protein
MSHYFIYYVNREMLPELQCIWRCEQKLEAQKWVENADYTCYLRIYEGMWNFGPLPAIETMIQISFDTFLS